MKNTLTFFEYKGAVAAISDLENGIFINDPKQSGQLGIIVSSENIGLPKEVKEIILNRNKRQGGSFASMMITKHTDGESSIGLLGFNTHLLAENNSAFIEISRDCDLTVLDNCNIIENNPPDNFKNFIDNVD